MNRATRPDNESARDDLVGYDVESPGGPTGRDRDDVRNGPTFDEAPHCRRPVDVTPH